MRFAALLVASLFLVGCQTKPLTYIPPPIVETQPSWDGDKQNSGLIDYVDGIGFIITESAASRYTALTAKYGSNLIPPVKIGEGLKPYESNFAINSEYMAIFMELASKEKRGD